MNMRRPVLGLQMLILHRPMSSGHSGYVYVYVYVYVHHSQTFLFFRAPN